MSVVSFIRQVFGKEDLRTNDKLGVYPEKVHVPAFLERRYLKTARALAVISVISMCLNIMLGCVLFIQPSLVSSEPSAYAYNDTFRGFKKLENMYDRKLASDIIFEDHVREYIYLRHSVITDVDVMKARWRSGSKFYWMNAANIYNKFLNSDYTKKMSLITSSGYRQDVYFRWTRKIRNNRWVAEFDTYEFYGWQRRQGTRKRWRSYLVMITNNKIPYNNREHRLRNPLNVTVIGYFPTSITVKEQ